MSRLLSSAFIAVLFTVVLNAPGAFAPGAFFITPAYAAEEQFPFLGAISRGPVNVRAGANTNFESVDKLAAGAQVVVLAKSFEWYKVQLPSTAAAYVRADYVQVLERKTGALTGNRVNIRAKPNSTASTIGQLGKGEMVKLLEKINEWWKIEPPAGAVGWVHKDFLKMESPQVPADMVRKRAVMNVGVVSPAVQAPAPASTAVNVRGKIEAVAVPVSAPDIHYQISVDGKAVYYIKDVPHLDRFKDVMVSLDGTMAGPGPGHPLLHVKKISLLL